MQSASGAFNTQSTSAFDTEGALRALRTQSGTEGASRSEIIVNEKTYNKFKLYPTQNLEHRINEIINKNYFP